LDFHCEENVVRQLVGSGNATDCSAGISTTVWDYNEYYVWHAYTRWIYDATAKTFEQWQAVGLVAHSTATTGAQPPAPMPSPWMDNTVNLGGYCDQYFGTSGATPDDLFTRLVARAAGDSDPKYLAETAVNYYRQG